MKKSNLSLLLALCTASAASAAVTLSFETTTDGFVLSDNGGITAVAWENYNGGSLAITVPAGYGARAAVLDVNANSSLYNELQLALVNGGTLSYTVTLDQAGIAGANPGYFETIYIGNSTGGYDQGSGPATGGAFLYGGATLLEPFVFNVTMAIAAVGPNGASGANNLAEFQLGSGYNEIYLGLNSGGDGFTSAKYYVDNFTIAAVPEPSALALGIVALGGMALRRRR